MLHMILVASLVLAPVAAGAQSRGCIERPVGPPIDAAALAPVPGMAMPQAPRTRMTVAIPALPANGTECIAVMPPVRDVLRGEPAPERGLLRTDSGGDLLREAPPARPANPWTR